MTKKEERECAFFETLIAAAQSPRELDLHGRDVLEAEQEVGKFLDERFRAGDVIVRIVHGVGRGVLAQSVPSAVREYPHVLYTQRGDAGTAVYVVLDNI